MKKRKWLFRRIYLMRMTISMIVCFLLFIFGGHFIGTTIQLLNMASITSTETLNEFTRSDRMYGRIRLSEITYTEIDFQRADGSRYKGYLADFDQGYLLFFQSSDSKPQDYFILSQQWRNDDQMKTFRTLMVNQISESFSLESTQVDAFISPVVFFDARKMIERSIPIGMIWMFSVFVTLLIMLLSYMTLLGRRVSQSFRKYHTFIYDRSEVLFHNHQWTLTENAIVRHWFTFDLISIRDVLQIEIEDYQLILYFKNKKISLTASESLASKLKSAWNISSYNEVSI